MKFVKLLTVPAVLLASALTAVPASAHALNSATISVGCGTGGNAGKICVHLTGDIEQGNDERFVFVQVFASGTTTPLGTITFDLPAFGGTAQGCTGNHCDLTTCFAAITNSSATSFDVKIVKVTSDSAGLQPADLVIHLPNNQDVTFPRDTPAPIGTTDKCAAPPTATPAPTPTATPTPTANTTVALAQTGGFDFRLPLIGLVLLVAGGALLVVSASRRRSERTR